MNIHVFNVKYYSSTIVKSFNFFINIKLIMNTIIITPIIAIGCTSCIICITNHRNNSKPTSYRNLITKMACYCFIIIPNINTYITSMCTWPTTKIGIYTINSSTYKKLLQTKIL